MSQQSLYHIGAPNTGPSFWIFIESLYNGIYVGGIVRELSHRFRPVEQFRKFVILWALTYHDRSRRSPFEVSVAYLNLVTPLFWLVDHSGINDEVSTPLGNAREKRPVLLGVDGLATANAIINIKYPVLPNHF